MSAAVLRARGLGRVVDGRTLWRGLDVELGEGGQVALVGPSGSGKSLLLRTLVGLEEMEEGAVSWWGDDLAAAHLPRLRSRAGYLHQEPAFGEGTVAEAVEKVASFAVHGDLAADGDELRRRAGDLFRRLDPEGERGDLLERDAGDLSGGERRLAALVRLLVLEPDVLLLDEPVAGLDRELAERVRELLAERTWLWVAHHADQVFPGGVEPERVVHLGGAASAAADDAGEGDDG